MASPEIKELKKDPNVQRIVNEARNNSLITYFMLPVGENGEMLEVRREGRYPLVTHIDGQDYEFYSTLLRVSDRRKDSLTSGGEFRLLPNRYMQTRINNCPPEELPDPNVTPIIIVDTIPIFLKSLSLFDVQSTLMQSRWRVATAAKAGVLIQTRASDISDGEYRDSDEGQLDIHEEVWYAKVLTVMKAFPGMNLFEAEEVLEQFGYMKQVPDVRELAVDTAVAYYYRGKKPEDVEVVYLGIDDYVKPFVNLSAIDDKVPPDLNQESIDALVRQANPINVKDVEVDQKKYTVEEIANYPFNIEGLEYRIRRFKLFEEGGVTFNTIKVIQRGDIDDAFVRIDSICVNGVQGGDSHCDCRFQMEQEWSRANQGNSVLFISIEDHEGRGYAERNKGNTLHVQRNVNKLGPYYIGNSQAAALYYDSTGQPVDSRDYRFTSALLKYLNITHIPHLVTNNQQKIDAVRSVATIGELVSAKTDLAPLTQEALHTLQEKAMGLTGVIYHY